MKRLVVIGLVLVACSSQNVAVPSPSPTSPARSQAADLRARMDLLLSEQVMIVAKESAAAVNHSDEYGPYATLLGLNAADLSALLSRAFGDTTAVEFMNFWSAQNSSLVDYGIGVVTHNEDTANRAMNNLTVSFAPRFAQFLTTTTHVSADPTSSLITEQVSFDKAVIDDVFGGNFTGFYADLHRAYAHVSRLGDLLSEQIAIDFPDKFPGDAAEASVDARVNLNLDLQEHSYLATMATDAAINHRDTERTIALTALAGNVDSLRTVVEDSRFALVWSGEISSLQQYALTADPKARADLTGALPTQLAGVIRVKSNLVAHHEDASLQVVDDQRSKAPGVANDDRAAATSMQPIADSIG